MVTDLVKTAKKAKLTLSMRSYAAGLEACGRQIRCDAKFVGLLINEAEKLVRFYKEGSTTVFVYILYFLNVQIRSFCLAGI